MTTKKHLTTSTIFTGLFIAFVLAMLFIPSFKGAVMQGLIKTGLFKPNIPDNPTEELAAEYNLNSSNESILFKNLNGDVLALADLTGKVVFINFWATWCPPCIAEMPSIQKLYTSVKENEKVVFLMVDVDNTLEKAQKFMEKRKFDLPIYAPASPIPSSFLEGAIPTTLVLDKYGKIVFKHEGMGDYSNGDFNDFINKLANE